jgi:hypothetical protein
MQKIIERLSDWFGCVVVLSGPDAGDATGLAAALAGGLPLTTWAPQPGTTPAEAVRAFQAVLRERGLKRPLLVVGAGADLALLEAWPDAFKVLAAAAPDDRLGRLCDLTAVPGSDMAALAQRIVAAVRRGVGEAKQLNILVLYCDEFTHIETINEHLRSFSLHSKHNYFYFPVSDTYQSQLPGRYLQDWPPSWDMDFFDVVVWHYVVPAYLEGRISPAATKRLAGFGGLKVLFVQDEYDNTGTISHWMRRAGIDLMFTCVPMDGIDYAYPQSANPGVEFLPTLTGYVPEDRGWDRYALPMGERSLRLAYRGRVLPYRYGALAREKSDIGVRMKALCEQYGVRADIAVDEDSRIYGTDWYRFLGSARATLATESGSNVFDFDGSLAKAAAEAEAKGVSFEDFHATHLTDIEGVVKMNQVSPKIFEAIRMGVALVCFEGQYSGVIQPDLHYIPLKKDYSNVEEVFAKLEDIPLLEAMTRRAFDDVIGSGRYSYKAFAQGFDAAIDSRVMRPARTEIISSPILRRRRGEAAFEPIVRPTPYEHILNTGVLRGDFRRAEVEDAMAYVRAAEVEARRRHVSRPPAEARHLRGYEASAVVCYDFWSEAGASVRLDSDSAEIITPPTAWHYAAGLPLDLSGIDFAFEQAWVRAAVETLEGEVRVALYNGPGETLHDEKIIGGEGVQEIMLRIPDLQTNLLLFRTGQFEAAARARFVRADIIVAPAYAPTIVEAARCLADLEPGVLPWWH